MSINKSALIRYKILDTCFRNPGKDYFIEDLIHECNRVLSELSSEGKSVSRRQILYDIQFMESCEGWSVELERIGHGRRKSYRYSDIGFSIHNMPLNKTEIYHLKSAISILRSFEGMPQFDWLDEIIQKIDCTISPDNQHILSFDNNKYLKGIEYLGVLADAILYKKVLSIGYLPFGELEVLNITIHPYHLKQYNNRWFLFGYYQAKDKSDWNLALDRMCAVRETNLPYQECGIDWNEHFSDIVGVTLLEDVPLEEIVLTCSGRSGHYIVSKPIHESQRHRWIDGNLLEVRLMLRVNPEFEQFVLSRCNDIRIVAPVYLREKIAGMLKNALVKWED